MTHSRCGYVGVLGVVFVALISCQPAQEENLDSGFDGPVVVTTWPNVSANSSAFEVLETGGSAVDAIESGIRTKELDIEDESVGIGGLPDADGFVTLDACIMDSQGNAGSVTYLKNVLHPISVARRIMDSLDHVMLSGDGAYAYAISEGFETADLLTSRAKEKWEKWKKTQEKADNHDTIGMLAKDQKGNLSGGCSTSGMAFKKPGRVGDSPIIGAGLYVDNAVGAATATGKGEEVMKTVGSFLIVELMRNGYSPQEACELAVGRIIEKNPQPGFQVGYVALNRAGEVGAYSVQPGFSYSVTRNGQTLVNQAKSYGQ